MMNTTILADIIGEDRVIVEKTALDEYCPDGGLLPGKEAGCIVRPRNAADISEIVRLANESGYALIPRSSQGPPSREDAVPEVDGAVIVDLSGMKAIIRMDRRNKVALIEPGVIFGELKAEAASQGMRVLSPLHPPKTKSVLGSYLEREPFTIPKYHWDMTDPLMCVQVVFGQGDTFATGSAAGPGTLEEQWATGQAQKSPLGPGQADLLRIIQGAQGTMGIVTWGSVKLELLPAVQKAFFVTSRRLGELIDFTYALNKFKLPDVCLILNAVDLGLLIGDDKRAKDLPPWALLYSLSGYLHNPQARLDYLERDVADMANAAGVVPMREIAGITAEEVVALAEEPCRDLYWKARKLGAFRDIFFLTTLDRTPGFLEAMQAIMKKDGFGAENLGIYIQPIRQGSNCHMEFNLFFDPDKAGEREKVRSVYRDASETLVEMGAFFSRPYGEWSDLVYARDPETVSALRKMKNILDPGGVMNPGKLCFPREG